MYSDFGAPPKIKCAIFFSFFPHLFGTSDGTECNDVSFLNVNFLLFFSCSVMPNFLWPHKLQYTSLPCTSSSPRACSKSCSLTQWCHATILFFVVPFSSCPQSFPASGSFLFFFFLNFILFLHNCISFAKYQNESTTGIHVWVFSNESALRIRWPKCQSFSLSINPSNKYSGLIFTD